MSSKETISQETMKRLQAQFGRVPTYQELANALLAVTHTRPHAQDVVRLRDLLERQPREGHTYCWQQERKAALGLPINPEFGKTIKRLEVEPDYSWYGGSVNRHVVERIVELKRTGSL